MHNIKRLKVYALAREILRGVHEIRGAGRGFGDLTDQMQRAAISIVSNIAEGAGSGTDKQFRRFLSYAKGSTTELQSQLDILFDLGRLSSEHPLIDMSDHLAAMIEKLMIHLGSG